MSLRRTSNSSRKNRSLFPPRTRRRLSALPAPKAEKDADAFVAFEKAILPFPAFHYRNGDPRALYSEQPLGRDRSGVGPRTPLLAISFGEFSSRALDLRRQVARQGCSSNGPPTGATGPTRPESASSGPVDHAPGGNRPAAEIRSRRKTPTTCGASKKRSRGRPYLSTQEPMPARIPALLSIAQIMRGPAKKEWDYLKAAKARDFKDG